MASLQLPVLWFFHTLQAAVRRLRIRLGLRRAIGDCDAALKKHRGLE